MIVRICQEYCQTKPECCPNAECGKYLRLLELLREIKRGEDDVCIFGWFADFFLKLYSMVSRYCDFNKTIRILQQTFYYWAKNKALSRIYQFIHSRKKTHRLWNRSTSFMVQKYEEKNTHKSFGLLGFFLKLKIEFVYCAYRRHCTQCTHCPFCIYIYIYCTSYILCNGYFDLTCFNLNVTPSKRKKTHIFLSSNPIKKIITA